MGPPARSAQRRTRLRPRLTRQDEEPDSECSNDAESHPGAHSDQTVSFAGALLKVLVTRFWQDVDWRMYVTDERGLTVCNLHFGGTMSAH